MKCGENRDDTEYILSLSYGKDSIATIEACKQLGQRIDRIVHAEVWATQDIPAELPPMVEFKEKADKIILERYGIKVERVCAMKKNVGVFAEPCEWAGKLSYEDYFYFEQVKGNFVGAIKGFPLQRGSWCKKLKYGKWLQQENIRRCVLPSEKKWGGVCTASPKSKEIGAQENSRTVQYYGFPISVNRGAWCVGMKSDAIAKNIPKKSVQILGIASDEPKRIERHKDKLLPLVEIGWDEAYCRKWCEDNDLLSPTYTTSLRGGCWFCHNQGVNQLRLLRRDYPDLWKILLKWDSDSPVSFHPDGHTVHDFDKRFALEDEGILKAEERFRWQDIEHPQLRIDWSDEQ